MLSLTLSSSSFFIFLLRFSSYSFYFFLFLHSKIQTKQITSLDLKRIERLPFSGFQNGLSMYDSGSVRRCLLFRCVCCVAVYLPSFFWIVTVSWCSNGGSTCWCWNDGFVYGSNWTPCWPRCVSRLFGRFNGFCHGGWLGSWCCCWLWRELVRVSSVDAVCDDGCEWWWIQLDWWLVMNWFMTLIVLWNWETMYGRLLNLCG
jgi:hypothetical protein